MNKRRGISLIVLVITILVMIILAGVVIVSLQKNNPVEKAKEATFKTNLVSYIDELNMTLLGEEYVSGVKVINKTGDLKEFIPSFKKEDNGKFEILNNKLVYLGSNIKEEVAAIELGIIPNGKRTILFEKDIPVAEQQVDGEKENKTIFFGKEIEVKDSFEIYFEAMPSRETPLDDLNDSLNNDIKNQNLIIHPCYKNENNYAGVGLNLGTNGINVIEHSAAYYPFPIVAKQDLSKRHAYKLIVHDNTEYLFIDNVLVGKNKSKKNLMYGGYKMGKGDYGVFKGEIYKVRISKI